MEVNDGGCLCTCVHVFKRVITRMENKNTSWEV